MGTQFDAIIAKSAALGKALTSPITNFGLVQENALLSSKGLEKHVASLIAAGREAEAAALIQKDLAASYGGAEQAAELARQQDDLNRSWAQLSITLGSFALQPIAEAAAGASSALAGLRNILEQIGKFLPKPPSRPGGGAGSSPLGAYGADVAQRFKTQASFTRLGLPVIGAIASFFGGFAPGKKGVDPAAAVDPAADQKRLSLISAQNKVVTAQVQGYRRLALERERTLSLEREAADIERLKANKAGEPEVQARRDAGNQERFRIAEELKQAERERLASNKLISDQNRIQLEAAQRQIVFAQALAGIEGDRTRSQVQLYQSILLSTAALRDQQRDLGAQIGAAKLKGGDGAEADVARLVGQQQTIAEQIRLKLIEGADALRQAGTKLKEDLDSSILKLVGIRGSEDGLNKYLSGSDQFRRAEEDFRRLQPQLQQAKEDFRRLTGADPINLNAFSGRDNKDITDFINSVNNELKANRDVRDSKSALDANNAALVTVNTELTRATQDLALKDWNVSVVLNSQCATVTGATLGG